MVSGIIMSMGQLIGIIQALLMMNMSVTGMSIMAELTGVIMEQQSITESAIRLQMDTQR